MTQINCQRARDVLPELLDHRTAVQAHPDVRSHLANCPDCQREFAALTQTVTALDAMPPPTPSPRLRRNFYAMLEEEKHSAAGVRAQTVREHQARRATLWRWIVSPLAGCALLAFGFAIGQRNAAPAVSPANSPTPQVAATSDDGTKRQLTALLTKVEQQQQQIDKMTNLLGYSILAQQRSPASERLRDVLTAARSENATDKTLDDLIQALTLDPSANIRLRALEALYPHAERNLVRAGVLAALPRESNPLVQLELIDFVASARDRSATPLLERISDDEGADQSVRDAARLALAQL